MARNELSISCGVDFVKHTEWQERIVRFRRGVASQLAEDSGQSARTPPMIRRDFKCLHHCIQFLNCFNAHVYS